MVLVPGRRPRLRVTGPDTPATAWATEARLAARLIAHPS